MLCGIAGFFIGQMRGCTSGAKINPDNRVSANVGGIVGMIEQGELTYCLNVGEVNGFEMVGGIAGCVPEDQVHFTCNYYAPPCTATGAIGLEWDEAIDVDGTQRADVYDMSNQPEGLDVSEVEQFIYDFYAFPRCDMFFFQGNFYTPASGDPNMGPTGNWLDSPNFYDTSWYDSESSDYYISTPAQLAGLAFLVSQGIRFNDKYVVLMNNLNLVAHYWRPIGTEENPFCGVFVGNSKVISGVHIECTSPEERNTGLFGFIDNASIFDFALEDSRIVGAENTGGIVGFAAGATLRNCHVGNSVAISASQFNPFNIGGIIGYGTGAYISGCSNAATLTNEYDGRNLGGIIGYFSYGRMMDCLNIGALQHKYSDGVGGLVGYGSNDCTNCFYGGACTTGAVDGSDYDGAKKAAESTTAPNNLGNYTTYYNVIQNRELVAYENGLAFDGIYYYDESVNTSAFPIYAGDQGTMSAPFQIKTPQDLMTLAEEVNSGRNFEFVYFILANDLDFSDMPKDSEGSNYTPIGTYEKPFNGMFRGNGKTIRGVRINKTGNTEADKYNGLFGYISGPRGVVQDLTLADSRIAGYHYTGGIAGGNCWKIINCHVLSDVEICAGCDGAAGLGGIVGQNDCLRSSIHGYVIGCTSAATISGGDFSAGLSYGGIAGSCESPNGYDYMATIEDCFSNAVVKGSSRMGAILGYNAKGTDTSNITNTFFAAPCSGDAVGNVNSYYYPTDGVREVYPYAEDPGVMGEQLTVPAYASFENAPGLIFFENGLFYDGIYYTFQKSALDVTFSKAGYATVFSSAYKLELDLSGSIKAYIIAKDTEGQLSYVCIADSKREESENYDIPANTAVLLYNDKAVGVEDEAERTTLLYRYHPRDNDPSYPENLLCGSDKDALTTGGATYYKLDEKGGQWGWTWGAEGGAAFINPATHAYLALQEASQNSFYILSEEGPDGIQSIFGSPEGEELWGPTNTGNSKGIYNLAGQRLGKMQRGINIVNRKKVVRD